MQSIPSFQSQPQAYFWLLSYFYFLCTMWCFLVWVATTTRLVFKGLCHRNHPNNLQGLTLWFSNHHQYKQRNHTRMTCRGINTSEEKNLTPECLIGEVKMWYNTRLYIVVKIKVRTGEDRSWEIDTEVEKLKKFYSTWTSTTWQQRSKWLITPGWLT